MRLRASSIFSTIILTLCVATGNASAATLWTSTTHTARVTVGAAATLTTTGLWRWTSGTAAFDQCAESSLQATVSQNNDTRVILNVNISSFSSCSPFSFVGTHVPPWQFTISGTGIVSGTSTVWPAALHDFSFDLAGGLYTGNFTTGVTATQRTATPEPVCFDFRAAGFFVGPLTGTGSIDATYCFTGTAAAWTLTN